MNAAAKRNVLITGANGQLGQSLKKIAAQYPQLSLVYTDLPDGDITQNDNVIRLLNTHKPELIINCAAYTAVDKAESEPELAELINAKAPGLLAEQAAAKGIQLLHVSTDYVFDGTANRPISEDTLTHPTGVYGASKCRGEEAIKKSGCDAVIVRTSWLYSEFGNNFIKTMIHLGKTQPELRVVADQFGNPTYANDLAHALFLIAIRNTSGFQIYHYCNQGTTTWHQLAQTALDMAGIATPVQPITSAEFRTSVKRPAYSALNSEKIEQRFGIPNRPWQEALKECVQILNAQNSLSA